MLGKKTKNKREVVSKSYDQFKVSSKRADEIISAFRHAKLDHDTWTEVWNEVAKTLKGENEYAYAGFVFGRMYSMDLNPLTGLLKHMMEHEG